MYTSLWENIQGLGHTKQCCLPGLAQGKESNSSMLRFQTCVDSDLRRHYPDCIVFPINFCYAKATSHGLGFYVSVPALGARWQFTQRCALTGIFLFMAYLPTAGTCTDHGLKAGCLPVCHSLASPILTQLSDKHLHGSMGWFIQHNLAAAQRFVS